MTMLQKLEKFIDGMNIDPEEALLIKAMVAKIQYEAYAEGRRDEAQHTECL